MVSAEVKIKNRLGLHARPANKLVGLASQGSAEVFFEKDGQRVNGRSILGVMLLQAEQGSTVNIIVTGENEAQLLEQLVGLVKNKFGEE